MRSDAAEVLRDALTLPERERAEIAGELLASLDSVEENVEAAWAAEIERRARDARGNPQDDEDWRAALTAVQREVLTR
jgi:putative addiction module component (TIGR02574 family)